MTGIVFNKSSERITIWVRGKGELAEGSPSYDSAKCAPCRSSYLANLWRTAMANPSRKRKCHVICRPLGKYRFRIPKLSSWTVAEVDSVKKLYENRINSNNVTIKNRRFRSE